MNQKAATNRKLSQASPVVHDSNPTSLFSGTIKGCEYAKALVTCGGVASNSGLFWCTRIVDRCLVCGYECEDVGEKAATVGGLFVLLLLLLVSFLSCFAEWCPPFADVDEVSDMEVIQGVSVVCQNTNNQSMLLTCFTRCCPVLPATSCHCSLRGKPEHKRSLLKTCFEDINTYRELP